ncbi:restriction endonuclease subunit S [Staphylococcus chromogenes]|uniref:restriction endonuclease subunit S n=1 Tax=Staphylococcus chromogenes TaxID=46126 RepID=UPI000D1C52B4|nr:restriction endonuclease subunit S [Staphylococcus chromogenes]PTF46610.1 restriction endonuclease subunit S [Staphylococcus chromogenes]
MTEHIKTPELRFPEFKDKWNQIKLKEICDITSSKRIYAKDYVRRGIPFFRGKEISSNGFKHQEDLLYISEEIYNYFSEKYGSPKEGDLLITSVGTIGNVALVPSDFKFYFKDGNLIWLKDIKMNSHFLKYYLESIQGKKRLLDKASGSNQKALTISGLESLKVNTTNNNEEIKIKNFFNKLDRQIELEEEKLELLEQQKKGYMQKIFSQQLRFKDENGNEYPAWNKTLIKDIFIFENNRRKPITSSLREKGNYPYYGATGIIDYVKDYLFDNEERLLIGEDGAKWGQFETSSFIANGKYWVNNHAHVVKSNDHNLYFMNYYLNFKELRTFVTGNAPAKLTHANLCSMSIEMPIRNEQDKISQILQGIENRINKQNIKIQLLQQRKQGLLQKMFV